MLRAYLDESESHKKPEFLVLAGYIASEENWFKLSHEWNQVLSIDPPIKYFKLREAIRQPPFNQFRGFSTDQCNSRIALFRGLIEKYCLAECAIAFRMDHFKNGYAANMPFPSRSLRSAFCFAWLHLTFTVAKNLHRIGLPRQEIEFVLDHRLKEETRIISGFRNAQSMQRALGFPSLVDDVMQYPPVFADDKQVLPLQSADMLATICRRHLESEMSGVKLDPLPGFTRKLSSCVQMWNQKQFRERAAKDRGFIRAKEMIRHHVP